VQDIFGSIFTRTELSEVLTEIVKMDPKFDKEQFLKDCETDFIPNILEAISRNVGDCRNIKLTEGNANSLRLKSNLQKEFASVVYLFVAPLPSQVCFLGLGKQICMVGSESGHLQSVLSLANMVCNTPQHPPSHPIMSAYT
jgi:hypothetical protein